MACGNFKTLMIKQFFPNINAFGFQESLFSCQLLLEKLLLEKRVRSQLVGDKRILVDKLVPKLIVGILTKVLTLVQQWILKLGLDSKPRVVLTSKTWVELTPESWVVLAKARIVLRSKVWIVKLSQARIDLPDTSRIVELSQSNSWIVEVQCRVVEIVQSRIVVVVQGWSWGQSTLYWGCYGCCEGVLNCTLELTIDYGSVLIGILITKQHFMKLI